MLVRGFCILCWKFRTSSSKPQKSFPMGPATASSATQSGRPASSIVATNNPDASFTVLLLYRDSRSRFQSWHGGGRFSAEPLRSSWRFVGCSNILSFTIKVSLRVPFSLKIIWIHWYMRPLLCAAEGQFHDHQPTTRQNEVWLTGVLSLQKPIWP